MLGLIVSSVLAAVFSAIIMTYVALATPLGPWIEPVIVVALLTCMRVALIKESTHHVVYATVAGGVAGIAGTAIAFSFPTLLFLDHKLFVSWLAQPSWFIAVVASLIILAGICALALMLLVWTKLLKRQDLPFPVSKMAYTLLVQNSVRSGRLLLGGCISVFIFYGGKWLLWAKKVTWLDSVPLLIALGFVGGVDFLVPLTLGGILKFCGSFFAHMFAISLNDMVMSVAAGMVAYGALQAVLSVLTTKNDARQLLDFFSHTTWAYRLILVPIMIIVMLFFRSFNFSLIAILYTIICAALCSYQVMVIAGKIGMAFLGRFATFVLLPGLILFRYSFVQAVLVTSFVELFSGISADMMFGQHLAQQAKISHTKIYIAQIFGLIAASITIAFVVWVLAYAGELGSSSLPAQRAAMRALLIKGVGSFNSIFVVIGAVSAFIAHYFFRVNNMMILSGLLLPYEVIIPLVAGSLLNFFMSKRKQYYPLFAGIFSMSSLWLVGKVILQLL